MSFIGRHVSRFAGMVKGSRFSGNELQLSVEAIKAAPAGYARMKKRVKLFKHMAPVASVVPSSGDTLVANNTELIYLAAIYAEAGMFSRAADALGRTSNYHVRFLELTKAAAVFSDSFATRYRADLDALQFLSHHEGSFAKLIRENSGSICVVGNSPCDVGRGLGKAIDSHALVIRFNNFSTAREFSNDYGTKCDVWCRSPFYQRVVRRQEFRPHLTITGSPIQWRKEDGQDMAIEYMGRDEALDVAPVSVVSTAAVRCGAPPSSGIVTLAWIESVLGSLDGVSVCGFALTDQAGGTKHYFKTPPRMNKPSHDWTGERDVFDEMSASFRRL
ncbi:MAG: glycosyltransferase family 29 protein [Pseudomonadota bacterium]